MLQSSGQLHEAYVRWAKLLKALELHIANDDISAAQSVYQLLYTDCKLCPACLTMRPDDFLCSSTYVCMQLIRLH